MTERTEEREISFISKKKKGIIYSAANAVIFFFFFCCPVSLSSPKVGGREAVMWALGRKWEARRRFSKSPGRWGCSVAINFNKNRTSVSSLTLKISAQTLPNPWFLLHLLLSCNVALMAFSNKSSF